MTVNKGKETFDSDVQWFLQHLLCLNCITHPLSFLFYSSTANGVFFLSHVASITALFIITSLSRLPDRGLA